ncbi:hypothetical protein DPMN_023984 [Dreissena polymorpha]|uniref:Uncharacterized protein n=1 Tax=Dreissena polymorpha TaxID=45954 RepID=A0A9D4LQK3_DREPO|nr:hypothetical protein DPMN_023984 [Dreissena polymorpha]
MLEKNYRVHCSLNNIPISPEFDVKTKVNEILTSKEYDSKRPRQMDIDDFLG